MSTDSLALTRKTLGPDLAALADQHIQHDLTPGDRETLASAARTISTHATVGSLLGLGLGVVLAYRLRSARTSMFRTFQAREKPTHLKFKDGREEAIPDITPFVKPSAVGDVATYALVGVGGLFFGGEMGLLTGSFRARSAIWQERDSRERILGALRAFQADALRAQAKAIESGERGVVL